MAIKPRNALQQINSDLFEAALANNLQAFESTPTSLDSPARPTITCLGESHGSHLFAMAGKTLPGTGALLIRLPGPEPDIILDPGWGTIAAARRHEIPVVNVGVILISHCHLDHVGDLHPLLLTLSLARTIPVLVANSTTINGAAGQPSVMPQYFRNLCKSIVVANHGKEISIGSLQVLPFRTEHRENKTRVGHSTGYLISSSRDDQIRIGLLTDGPLQNVPESILSKLRTCRALVINVGTMSNQPDAPSHSKIFDNALCLHGLQGLLKKLAMRQHNIEAIAITHLGAELLEVRSEMMKRFLNKSGKKLPYELLVPAVTELVRQTLGKKVMVKILREGSVMEV